MRKNLIIYIALVLTTATFAALFSFNEPADLARAQAGTLTAVGKVQPKDVVNLFPRVTGKVVKVMVRVGDEVKAGDVIAQINPTDFANNLKAAQADLSAATLELQFLQQPDRPEEILAAQKSVDNAQNAIDSLLDLSDDEKNLLTTQIALAEARVKEAQTAYDKIAWANPVGETLESLQLEVATAQYEKALANYDLALNPPDSDLQPFQRALIAAKLALALARAPYTKLEQDIQQAVVDQYLASVELAERRLSYTEVKAPLDGLVNVLDVSPGRVVGAFSDGAPLTRIAQLMSKEVRVVVLVAEKDLGLVAKGQAVTLQTLDNPGQDIPGVIEAIAPEANSTTHTFAVTIVPQEQQDSLRSGTSVQVTILPQ